MTTFLNMPKIDRTVEVHGPALRLIRVSRGRSVADLATCLGIDRSYITHIENGSKRRVAPELYSRLLAELVIDEYRALLANPWGTPVPEPV